MNIKRLLCMTMVVLMTAGLLLGCSTQTNDEKPSDTSAAEETTESKYLDALPESMDLAGEIIRFVCDEDPYNQLTMRSLVSEELTGDNVDDAVYKRNNIVMDRFNMDLEIVKTGNPDQVPEFVRQSILSNADDYDVVAGYQYYSIRLASEGLLLNLNSLPNLDFTQPYWSQSMIEGMSYGDNTYWCTGDLSLRYIGGMYVSFINKAIWNDYFPDIDCYDMALNGEWTLDALNEMAYVVYDDLNANGRKDSEDLLGLLFNIGHNTCDGLMMSSDITFSRWDDNGIPYLDYDMDRIVSFCEKMKEISYENEGVLSWGSSDEDVMRQFAESTVMCTPTRLYYSELHFREMEDDFAVLPMPKFDAEQENYVTTIHDGTTLFGIPITNSKIEATTMVLEALASEAYRTVTPVYYEMALKIKYVRDDMSAIMIDLIREGVTADFVFYYHIGDISWFFRGLITEGATNFTSSITAKENAWFADMEEVLQDLEKYGD